MRALPFASTALLCLVSIGLAACADEAAEGPDAVEEVRAPVARVAAPDVSADERSALTRDGRAFAFDLYGRARDDASLAGGNVVFSPLSVAYALAMTSAGARGATLDEARRALHLSLPDERLHPALNDLSLRLGGLPGRANERAAAGGERLTFSLVNAVWAQRGLRFEAPFLETLAGSYGAGVKVADFKARPEPARAAINAWVEAETGDRIRDLLPEGSVDPSTRLVLVNAVALSAPWGFAEPFNPALTRDGTFTRLDGSAATVPTMRRLEALPYAADGDLEAVALPLLGGELSVVIALPKVGSFAAVDASFGAERFDALVGALAPRPVDLKLPKFSLRSASLSLKPYLEALGMRAAFGDGADFSGITADEPLHVGDVLHQTTLGFNEAGVEAAAATAVPVNAGAAPVQPVAFAVDRPFFVAVRDTATNALLFWGRIVDPGATAP